MYETIDPRPRRIVSTRMNTIRKLTFAALQ